MTIPSNPHSKWYHCLCCMPTPEAKQPSVEPSPAGEWSNGKFHEGPKPTEAFKKEFEGK